MKRLITSVVAALTPSRRPAAARRPGLEVESLEDRRLLAAAPLVPADYYRLTPADIAAIEKSHLLTPAQVAVIEKSHVLTPAEILTLEKSHLLTPTTPQPSGPGWIRLLPLPVNDLPTVADGYIQDAGIRQVEHDWMQTGSLSRNGMLAIFAEVEQDGKVTAAEYRDLQTIVNTSSVFPMPDAVRNLATKVVDGDRADLWWTGGGTAATPLGTLHADDSAGHLAKLVDKWFLGQDHPAIPASTAGASFGYVQASGPLFGPGGPTFTDVRQGNVGDCYFLSSLAATALRHPELIRDMITDNGDGTYTVRFFKSSGAADYVTVDAYLPVRNGSSLYAQPGNALWAALVEKAYAQWNESGFSHQDGTNSYHGIEYGLKLGGLSLATGGGVASLALNQITGQFAMERVLPQVLWADDLLTFGSALARFFAFGSDPAGWVTGAFAKATGIDKAVAAVMPVGTVRDLVSDFRAGKTIVLCASKGPIGQGGGSHRLPTSWVAPNHCVALTNVSADGKTFTIYNQATGGQYQMNREQLLDTFALYTRTAS